MARLVEPDGRWQRVSDDRLAGGNQKASDIMRNSILNISNYPSQARGLKSTCGIMLSGLALAITLVSCPLEPASATYIKGYVSQEAVADYADANSAAMVPVPITPARAVIKVTQPAALRAKLAPVVQTVPMVPVERTPQLVSPAPLVKATMAEPAALLEGSWRCQTVVTDSSCRQVRSGQSVESDITFARSAGGGVTALWQQPGWTQSCVSVRGCDNGDVTISRLNQYHGGGTMTGWAAKSFDRYRRLASDRLVASSRVDQFVSGRYVGSYLTESVLQRVGGNTAADLAFTGR